MRHSLLASVLEVVERNSRVRERISIFEIGPIYLADENGGLPEEPLRVVIALSGPRALPAWQGSDMELMDFYDLKGLVAEIVAGLKLEGVHYEPAEVPSFHPRKCARIMLGEQELGVLGEVHPKVVECYDLPGVPLLVADLDMAAILAIIPDSHTVQSVPAFPPVLEDLAVVVDEDVPADTVENVLRLAGEPLLVDVRLFDLYRGEQVGRGRKSLAYSLVYQASDRTLTDDEVAKIRAKVIKRLESELGAKLRD